MISSSFRPLNTIHNSLRSVKFPFDPKNMKRVYLISYSCGTAYIGEISYSINQRIQESVIDKHCRCFSFTLVEHVGKIKHHICLEESQAIARIDHFHHWMFREAIKIERISNTLNKDDGWKIRSCWVSSLFFLGIVFFFVPLSTPLPLFNKFSFFFYFLFLNFYADFIFHFLFSSPCSFLLMFSENYFFLFLLILSFFVFRFFSFLIYYKYICDNLIKYN